MSAQTLAFAYAALATFPIAMQLAVALGAPLGRFTVGGRFPGRLPVPWRWLALLQAGILLAMSCAVLDRSGAITLGLPAYGFWLALAMTGLTTIANAISPSRPERLLWTPVLLTMSAAAIGVAFGGTLP
jgi:hypothetical protein